jgi:hypothetical protein
MLAIELILELAVTEIYAYFFLYSVNRRKGVIVYNNKIFTHNMVYNNKIFTHNMTKLK